MWAVILVLLLFRSGLWVPLLIGWVLVDVARRLQGLTRGEPEPEISPLQEDLRRYRRERGRPVSPGPRRSTRPRDPRVGQFTAVRRGWEAQGHEVGLWNADTGEVFMPATPKPPEQEEDT